ncbi:MAG: VWA domain-containing protein [Rhizobiales bacterium]|nr:VWA domain-containing protein [Hyphomicrobiales bacterium]
MALGSKLASVLRRMAFDQNGTTAVIVALAAVPMLLAAGVGIDMVRYASARSALQSALDAGALAAAAATNLSTPARIAAGDSTFSENIEAAAIGSATVSRSFSMVDGTVMAAASFELPVSLMQLAGFSAMEVEAETEINIPQNKKAEIALVLDYSGSMNEVLSGEVKYVAMRNAAKDLVNGLADSNPANVKFGLVPFSHHVWVTLPKQYVKGQSGAGNWTGCTQDRKYPHNVTDATPTSAVASKWGQPIAPVHASSGCGAYVPNDLIVKPLTDDFAAINTQLDAMEPYAWTHIALGAEFGYHLLSPNAPFAEGASYADTTTQKIMVLLTDGMQTEPAFGPGPRTVAQGEDNLEEICANAKASGITVMSIAYNIDDVATVDRLRNCTTDPDKDFFSVGEGENIAAAFDAIKQQITAQIFIGK